MRRSVLGRYPAPRMHFHNILVGERPYCGAEVAHATTVVPELVTCSACLEMMRKPVLRDEAFSGGTAVVTCTRSGQSAFRP